MGNVGLLEPIRDYVDALVHPSAQADVLTRARHRAFMAPRLLGTVAIVAAFPIYLVMRGVPSALEVLGFAWLIAPILSAYFLSRTGRYERAHVLSSIALTGLIAVVAAKTGGITSFAAIWLVIVPLEATLSASRRVVAIVSTIAITACGLLVVVSMVQGPPSAPVGSDAGQLAALGVVSAMLYATGLALGAERLARASVWRLRTEENKYQLLARNMTDVITRHGRNGATLFASPGRRIVVWCKTQRVVGHGLFDQSMCWIGPPI